MKQKYTGRTVPLVYNDVMLCYGITPEELKAAYTEKFEKNMKRW